MFDSSSRYASLPVAEIVVTERNGTRRLVRYVRRRLIPVARPILTEEHTVADGERLDAIAAAHLGNAKLGWRICDANRVLNPFDLVRPGATIVIETISSSAED